VRAVLTALFVLVLLGIAACGGGGDGAATTSAAGGPCEEATVPPAKQVDIDAPPSKPSAARLTAVVDTSCGSFEIALDTRSNPKSVASFEHLAESGFYDDTTIHRIALNPPVIQGGDPLGTGLGGPGYSVDEEPPPDTAYTRGVAAMAKTEAEPPGRSGSQFFVVTAADAGLPPIYAVLGKVTKGLDVVTTISQFGDPTGQSEVPLEPVAINSVTIEER
jgi:cyclophilin family peptidyl-prolyl cis-trans isomerase